MLPIIGVKLVISCIAYNLHFCEQIFLVILHIMISVDVAGHGSRHGNETDFRQDRGRDLTTVIGLRDLDINMSDCYIIPARTVIEVCAAFNITIHDPGCENLFLWRCVRAS